jgi:hypothetical protein
LRATLNPQRLIVMERVVLAFHACMFYHAAGVGL